MVDSVRVKVLAVVVERDAAAQGVLLSLVVKWRRRWFCNHITFFLF